MNSGYRENYCIGSSTGETLIGPCISGSKGNNAHFNLTLKINVAWIYG